jgi:hypothetical protein
MERAKCVVPWRGLPPAGQLAVYRFQYARNILNILTAILTLRMICRRLLQGVKR